MRFIALQHKSTETKMENNSFAGTCEQADRLNTRQGKCDDKKRNGKSEKKKMWVHHVCNWEYRRSLRHPKRFFTQEISFTHSDVYNALKNISLLQLDLKIKARPPVILWRLWSIEAIKHNICAQIYTASRISQRDFPVMHFVALQHKSKRIIKNCYHVYKAAYNNFATAKLLCKLLE